MAKKKSKFLLIVQPKDEAAYIQPGFYLTEQDAVKSAQGYAMAGETLFTIWEIFPDGQHCSLGWYRKTSYNHTLCPKQPFNVTSPSAEQCMELD